MSQPTPPRGRRSPGPVPAAIASGAAGGAWTRAQALAFDRHLQADCGIPAQLLMENAGAALAVAVAEALETAGGHRVLFLVGPGNNGGDALVAARQLHREPGLDLLVAAPLGPPERAGGPAALAWACCLGVGIPVGSAVVEDALAAGCDLIVDGLFGVGLSRPLQGQALAVVEAVNRSGIPVLAVDVPSGLDCDSGAILGAAVRARWTLTFVAPKIGFFRCEGPACCGALAVAGIGVSEGYARKWGSDFQIPS